jgi:hypothetical protein
MSTTLLPRERIKRVRINPANDLPPLPKFNSTLRDEIKGSVDLGVWKKQSPIKIENPWTNVILPIGREKINGTLTAYNLPRLDINDPQWRLETVRGKFAKRIGNKFLAEGCKDKYSIDRTVQSIGTTASYYTIRHPELWLTVLDGNNLAESLKLGNPYSCCWDYNEDDTRPIDEFADIGGMGVYLHTTTNLNKATCVARAFAWQPSDFESEQLILFNGYYEQAGNSISRVANFIAHAFSIKMKPISFQQNVLPDMYDAVLLYKGDDPDPNKTTYDLEN